MLVPAIILCTVGYGSSSSC